MVLTGPSFNTSSTHDDVTCVFTDDDGDVTVILPRTFERPIKGIIENCKAICPMPLFRKLGPHNLTITVNGSSYVGEFEVGKTTYIQFEKCKKKKHPDRLVDSCKHSSVNQMAAGSRL